MQGRRLSWLVGGIGLIACGVVGVVRTSVLGSSGTNNALTLISDLLWAGSILLLAVGLSREGSVVARKPLGLVSAVVIAVWPVTRTLVGLVFVRDTPQQAAGWLFWDYASTFLPFVIGLIAAMQVARAGVVPRPWNWAPLWALGAKSAMWVLPQLIGSASPSALIQMPGLVSALGMLGFLATTLGLGVVAVVLANRTRAGVVPIFRSSTLD
ncbi:MAG: hypothetical protein ACTH2J_03700 [Candidatus Microbacterium stercoravium]